MRPRQAPQSPIRDNYLQKTWMKNAKVWPKNSNGPQLLISSLARLAPNIFFPIICGKTKIIWGLGSHSWKVIFGRAPVSILINDIAFQGRLGIWIFLQSHILNINFIAGEWSGFTNRAVDNILLQRYFNEINCRKRPGEFCKFRGDWNRQQPNICGANHKSPIRILSKQRNRFKTSP